MDYSIVSQSLKGYICSIKSLLDGSVESKFAFPIVNLVSMEKYNIRNKRGMRVGVLTYGGYLTNIDIPLKDGGHYNTILSYPNVQDYQRDIFYLGATLGRYANRINQGRFSMDRREVQLSINEQDGVNHLHGGFEGFNRRTWKVLNHDDSSISLEYFSKDGEEGYPGNVRTVLTYKVEEENSLSISFCAESDQPTILNLSNHCYFKLSDVESSVKEHQIEVFASHYTSLDERNLPFNGQQPVERSVFDLRKPRVIHEMMDEIVNTNYCFEDRGEGLKDMARLSCPSTERSLLIQATYPGLQVYFGNFLDRPFIPSQGVCLEPQFYPDSPNHSTFPSSYLAAGEIYQHQIWYSFFNF